MKKICFLLILICLLQFSFGYSAPPVLFFKKSLKTSNRQKKIIIYKVKKGEYLYAILRKLNIDDKYIPLILKDIKNFNKDIKDLNKLYVGQLIRIPINNSFITKRAISTEDFNFMDKSIVNLPLDEIRNKYPFKEQKYTVKKGDCVVNLLMKIGGLPIHLIFNEYLTIFKKLNPNIKDINFLNVGTEIIIPVLPNVLLFSEAKKTPILNDKEISLLILKKIGFKIVNKTNIVYPTKDGEWIEIDTNITPLVISQNEKKILIVPEKIYSDKYSRIEASNIYLCKIKDFNAYNVLKQIEKFDNELKIWNQWEKIIISKKEITLETKSDIIVIKKYSSDRSIYFLFYFKSEINSFYDKLKKSLLANYDIFIYDLSRKDKDFIGPDKKIIKNIFVPNVYDDLKDISEKNIVNADTVTIKLPFKNNGYLYVNVKRINNNYKYIYLIDKMNKSLVALLRALGYESYTF